MADARSRSAPIVSVVTCSADDRRFAALSEMYCRVLAGTPSEIVRVAKARSLADGYNRGLRHSHGDLLIFSHDDVEVLAPDFLKRVEKHLRRFDVVGVAGTSRLVDAKWAAAGHPYIFGQVAYPAPDGCGYTVAVYGTPSRAVGGIQGLDGVLIAVKRSVLEQVRFDQETFDGFHLYDLDFTYRAYRAGFRLGVANDFYVIHHSGGEYGREWARYAECFVRKHGAELSHSLESRPPWHRWAVVDVVDRRQLMQVMTPPYWGPADVGVSDPEGGRLCTSSVFA